MLSLLSTFLHQEQKRLVAFLECDFLQGGSAASRPHSHSQSQPHPQVQARSSALLASLSRHAGPSVLEHGFLVLVESNDRFLVQVLVPVVSGGAPFVVKKTFKLKRLKTIDGAPNGIDSHIRFFFKEKNVLCRVVNVEEKPLFLWYLWESLFEQCNKTPALLNITDMELRLAAMSESMKSTGPSDAGPSTGKAKAPYRDLINEKQEEDLRALSQSHNFDIRDTRAFVLRLEEELSLLEKTNIFLMLEHERDIRALSELAYETSVSLGEIEANLKNKDKILGAMRLDLNVLQRENMRRERKLHNEQELSSVLSNVLEPLELEDWQEDMVQHPLFDSDEDLEAVVATVRQLERGIRACSTVTPGLEKMTTLFSERSSLFTDLLHRVCEQITAHLKIQFRTLASAMESSRAITTSDGTFLESHFSAFDELTRYVPLTSSMATADITSLDQIRLHYSQAFQPVYRKQLHAFFKGFRRQIDSLLCKDGIIGEQIFHAKSPIRNAMREEKSYAVFESLQSTFALLFDNLIDLASQEEEFCSKFFAGSLKSPSEPPENQDSDSEEDDSEEEDEISAVSPSKLAGPRASPTTDQHAKHSLHLEKLQKMVQSLFSDVEKEGTKFFKWLTRKSWAFYTLPMILESQLWMSRTSDPSSDWHSENLYHVVTSLQLCATHVFSVFVDCEAKEIQNYKVPIKREGVIPAMRVFPQFVFLCEKFIHRDVDRSLIDQSYHKLMMTIQQTVKRLAKTSAKYTAFFSFVNWTFWLEKFSDTRVESLQRYVEDLIREQEASFEVYATEMVTYVFGSIFNLFFQAIDFLANGMPAEHLPYETNLTKRSLQQANSDFSKKLQRRSEQLFLRLEKHMTGCSYFLSPVWKKLRGRVTQWYAEFVNLVEECYDGCTPNVTMQDLQAAFDAVEVKYVHRLASR